MARTPRIPKYRRHSSGQARVTFNGKDHLLGPYNSPESKEAYRRLLAERLERQGKPAAEEDAAPITINELILAYWKFAQGYYNFDGSRGDAYCLRDALRIVRSLYGKTAASDFGPLALKSCRRQMIEKGWSRNYINAQTDRVRRMFRWAAEEEMLPASIYQDLKAVAGLRRGKTTARETKRVRPVPQEHIDASLPYMPVVVQAMVQIQLLTGCRPAEVCLVRPVDIDLSNPSCWVYRPHKHKTEHHNIERVVLVGPRAQAILRPYLGTKEDTYCFSPAKSEARRNAVRRASRKSPMTPSQRTRQSSDRHPETAMTWRPTAGRLPGCVGRRTRQPTRMIPQYLRIGWSCQPGLRTACAIAGLQNSAHTAWIWRRPSWATPKWRPHRFTLKKIFGLQWNSWLVSVDPPACSRECAITRGCSPVFGQYSLLNRVSRLIAISGVSRPGCLFAPWQAVAGGRPDNKVQHVSSRSRMGRSGRDEGPV